MNDKEKKMYDAIFKIERNIDILEYVHDSILEGSGKDRGELFEGAILEIVLNMREGLDAMYQIIEECEDTSIVTNSKSWQFSLYKYLTNNEITAEQYLKICDALCISISELDNEKTLPTVQTHERKGETI